MTRKSVPPAVTETAFDCPNCGAYTTQFWLSTYGKFLDKKRPVPYFSDAAGRAEFAKDTSIDPEQRDRLLAYIDRVDTGLAWLQHLDATAYLEWAVDNVHFTKCYNCTKLAVWVYKRLVFPEAKPADLPNDDLPADIAKDFEEARSIVSSSPRGAAALLRLCIQKLCIELGEKGKNIDNDIASLVRKGLNPLVQKALDIVRVIGNENVHPGTLDLRDDQATAMQLFRLVNLIAEQMITIPKSVETLYESLPEAKREWIAKRDGQGT